MRSGALLLLSLFLSACGSETVNITLLTPIPIANPTRNLAETLLIQGGTSNALVASINGPSCKQRDLRAGFKAPGWNTPWVPVLLDTEIINFNQESLGNKLPSEPSGRPNSPSFSTATMSAYLSSRSSLRRPIVIPVPKGVGGELSIQGMLVEPIDQFISTTVNVDATPCKRLEPTNQLPIKTFAVYGSMPFKSSVAGEASLDVNVIQSSKPSNHGNVPVTYTLPTLPGPNDTSSDFKCRRPGEPKSCTNRDLLRLRINLGVSAQFLIQHPPPPSNEALMFFMGLPYSTTATPSTKNSFYFPKLSPILLTYLYGAEEWKILVRFFQKEISYSINGTRISETLVDCTSFGASPPGWVANLPKDPANPPGAAGCSDSAHNFAINDQGAGYL